jgi:hypothetical protein
LADNLKSEDLGIISGFYEKMSNLAFSLGALKITLAEARSLGGTKNKISVPDTISQ